MNRDIIFWYYSYIHCIQNGNIEDDCRILVSESVAPEEQAVYTWSYTTLPYRKIDLGMVNMLKLHLDI